jgi:MSHA biogenesis protein MshP
MSRFAPFRPAPARSTGIGLVTAIFLLVVLAALATAMLSISTTQRTGALLDEQGARAYQAARAGLEWGMYMHTQGGGCPGLNYAAGTTTSTNSFALPAGTSLEGFVVTVRCEQTAPSTDPLMRVIVTAIACKPSNGTCPFGTTSPDYVQRVLEAQL